MGLTEFLHHSMEWIAQSGWVGVAGFIILYTLTCVFFLPGSVLTVGAGAVYGFWFSTVLVTISSTVGAVVNFLTSRYLARSWMQKRLGRNAKFLALERAVSTEGWRMMLISICWSRGRQGCAYQRGRHAPRPCHLGVLWSWTRCDTCGHGAYHKNRPAKLEDLLGRTRKCKRIKSGGWSSR
jgi:hypothetical protein